MATLEKRVQVLFSTEQFARLEAEAKAERMSVGAFIRDAVDAELSRQRDAARKDLRDLWAWADELPPAGEIDWDEEKAAFERDMLRDPDERMR
jgi:hypothetical protein